MHFTLDEPLFPDDFAFHGLLTHDEIAEFEKAWKVLKMEEWATVARLNSAQAALRRVAGLPTNAPAKLALLGTPGHDGAIDKANAGSTYAALVVTEAHAATRAYEQICDAKNSIRRRAHVA